MELALYSTYFDALRRKTARNYYVHGLFCASHPYSIICLVTVVVLFCCFPLTKLPLPGYAPLEFVTPINEFVVAVSHGQNLSEEPKLLLNGADGPPDTPEWLLFNAQPDCYVQQIVVKAKVSPWTDELIPIDAIRRPLGLVFNILEEIQNSTIKNQKGDLTSLRDHCFEAQTVMRKYRSYGFLSENDCLLISPANIWDLDLAKYQADSDILGTVFAHDKRTTIDSSPAFKDLAFGIPWLETGIKTQFLGGKSRIIGFAVTVILKEYDRRFIETLASRLRMKFSPDAVPSEAPVNHIINIRFQTLPEIVQFLPLILTYIVVLLYLCFSVSKLEMVKSKIGLAISAVITIIASLAMSAGLCSHFGLYSTLSGGEIFPYLVVIIGLENVIVITKSVVSTSVQLDVKFRIAQGLSREGWGITKNFLTELVILIIGYLTCVPAIQEFCMFGFVGLLSDMFLQLVFFSAVLSIDIGRMELADHLSNRSSSIEHVEASADWDGEFPEVRCPVMAWIARSPPVGPTETSPQRHSKKTQETPQRTSRVARRVRLLWFFGSQRVMQRVMMALTLSWIVVLVYQSGFLKRAMQEESLWNSYLLSRRKSEANVLDHVHKLSYRHWPTLFGYYNISLAGKYISILPPISLSAIVSPAQAVANRHPLDHKKTPWKSDDFIERQQEYLQGKLEEQERWVLIALGLSTGVVLLGLCLYGLRMVWPAKQRFFSSLTKDFLRDKKHVRPFLADVQVHSLAEHLLTIKSMVVHEDRIATSCLAGQLRIWNWNEKRPLLSIKRIRSAAEEGGFYSSSGSFFKDFFIFDGRQIRALAFKNDLLVAGCADGAIEIYNAQTGLPLEILSASSVAVSALALSNGTLLTGRENGDFHLFLQRDGNFVLTYTAKLHHAAIGKISLLPDRIVTVGFDNSIKILHSRDLVCLSTLWNASSPVTAFFVDESSMTAVSGYEDGRVRIWNLATGSSVNEYIGAVASTVRSVCLSEEYVLASYVGGKVSRWKRKDGNSSATISLGKSEMSSLCLREGFFFVGFLGEVRVYECNSLEMVKTVALDGSMPDYISCPNKFIVLENFDIVCDYGRQVRMLRFNETRKTL